MLLTEEEQIMLKLTSNQISFLKDVISEAEMENIIGYPQEDGEPSDRDKELIVMIKFIKSLKSGDVLTIK